MAIIETKKRSVIKSIIWRVIATLNSYTILSVGFFNGNLINAIMMNVTGLIIMYFYERIWSKINYGRYNEY
jgi:uncharacterized membrane protein